MVNPWLAMASGVDPAERRGSVGSAHAAFVSGGEPGPALRPVVADSWRRSAAALPTPEFMAPVELADADLEGYRRAHPLARAMPLFRELLGSIADDGAHLLAVCDASGRMLWVEGHAGLRGRAEHMNFVPGARWDERHAGTNAPGTALALDHAVQIFATEHYNRLAQPWTCAAAPVHDPATGRLLGAVDITGGDHLAAPHSLALVQATARAAEAHLAAGAPGPRSALSALGRDEALLTTGGRRVRLGRRHSEILVLLAAHPDGLTGEQLSAALYGERAVPMVTLRAEISRLRRLAGELLASRPYRLTGPVETDAADVEERLAAGDLRAAVRAYDGPLLPASEAPGVCRLRRLLEDRLRRAVLGGGDATALQLWAERPWGEDDLEVWERLLAALPESAAHRGSVAARARGLRATFAQPARG
ncbi:helix-turn-helix domain-containing protein [Streptomyces griseocarneus]|uniref:helix-turn-helix domain-containing protein n=1 Tax=Streptomyces griseocarneus TaxID=51201 RepID=UPI00167D921E|nr:helix-turn-helix domain-containing protein [Streptomyces griseocarneus]MBZ6477523.1 GAF domain-containing protein [Streptomyces griseocarneus]GHG82698.1 transcriptional regulator [Streptomyces griseocarneus]